MSAYELGQFVLELVEVAGVDEHLPQLTYQPQACLVHQFQIGVDPCIRMSLFVSFKREFLFGSGKTLYHSSQIIGFFKNSSGGRLAFLRLHS